MSFISKEQQVERKKVNIMFDINNVAVRETLRREVEASSSFILGNSRLSTLGDAKFFDFANAYNSGDPKTFMVFPCADTELRFLKGEIPPEKFEEASIKTLNQATLFPNGGQYVVGDHAKRFNNALTMSVNNGGVVRSMTDTEYAQLQGALKAYTFDPETVAASERDFANRTKQRQDAIEAVSAASDTKQPNYSLLKPMTKDELDASILHHNGKTYSDTMADNVFLMIPKGSEPPYSNEQMREWETSRAFLRTYDSASGGAGNWTKGEKDAFYDKYKDTYDFVVVPKMEYYNLSRDAEVYCAAINSTLSSVQVESVNETITLQDDGVKGGGDVSHEAVENTIDVNDELKRISQSNMPTARQQEAMRSLMKQNGVDITTQNGPTAFVEDEIEVPSDSGRTTSTMSGSSTPVADEPGVVAASEPVEPTVEESVLLSADVSADVSTVEKTEVQTVAEIEPESVVEVEAAIAAPSSSASDKSEWISKMNEAYKENGLFGVAQVLIEHFKERVEGKHTAETAGGVASENNSEDTTAFDGASAEEFREKFGFEISDEDFDTVKNLVGASEFENIEDVTNALQDYVDSGAGFEINTKISEQREREESEAAVNPHVVELAVLDVAVTEITGDAPAYTVATPGAVFIEPDADADKIYGADVLAGADVAVADNADENKGVENIETLKGETTVQPFGALLAAASSGVVDIEDFQVEDTGLTY